MASSSLHFPEPCPIKTSQMQACTGGFYCGSCQKKVTDLRQEDTKTVEEFVRQHPGACIIANVRAIEAPVKKQRIWKGFAFLVGLCFFLSSCFHQRRKYTVTGCPSFKQNPEERPVEGLPK